MKYSVALMLGLVVVLAACTQISQPIPSQPSPSQPISESGLEYISSLSELRGLASSDSMMYYGGNSLARTTSAPMMESAVAMDDFSGTNVQEAGVDEADIFKTDGEYIYTSSGPSLFITSVGDDAKVLSSTDIQMNVQGLFIQDNYLVVIGSEWRRGFSDRMIWPGPSSSDMIVRIYDVSSPEDISQVKEIEYEGRYVDARLKDGVAYVISNAGISYDSPMPLLRVDDVEVSMPVDRIAYFPGGYDNAQLTTIHTLDFSDLSVSSDAVVTENTHTVYMNENLYLSSTHYVNEWELEQEITIELLREYVSDEDNELIDRINAVDSDILSESEKQQKVYSIIMATAENIPQEELESLEDEAEEILSERLTEFEYIEYTKIASFSVSADGVSALATGQVPGRVYDSFGFDEVDSVLRIVTTTSGEFDEDGKLDRESENHLFTLDSEFEVLDSISEIAPTERIFSARYTDERLYLVTFEQVDPFFVIDVSDARNLEILGELKITGFSRYLHPLSEDVVLGFGREASDRGRQEGLKVSLFDVSDVNNPSEIAKWVSDDDRVSSSAEFEHKAILIDVNKELLVLPVNSYERDNRYSGAFVFDLTLDDVQLRGLIDHDEHAVERSAWIGDLLYTKSYDLLRVNELDTLEGVVDIDLEQVNDPDVPVY